MGVGITTWIKESLLKNIGFNRRGCRGMGKPSEGITRGRKIDQAFKGLCTTGKAPPGTKGWVIRRIKSIEQSLAKAKVRLHSANVFVSIGNLKTHLDGVGTHIPTGETVVLELKSTQATLNNHRAAYDVACSTQPTVMVNKVAMANTERLHHALQLAFGVHALPTASRGFVIISASDGAALYPLNRGIDRAVFTAVADHPRPANSLKVVTPCGKRRLPRVRPVRWPGSSVALPGWSDINKVRNDVFVVQKNGTRALATAVKTREHVDRVIKKLKALRKRTRDLPTKMLVVRPHNGRWICHLAQ